MMETETKTEKAARIKKLVTERFGRPCKVNQHSGAQSELASRLGYTPRRVSELLSGRGTITPALESRIYAALQCPE